MDHPLQRLRLPEAIRSATIAFLNWYYNDLHVHQPPHLQTTHAESSEFIYDWRPRQGESRLSLIHIPTGRSAANLFTLDRIGATDPATIPPPPSLLMTTWFDLCTAIGWLDEGAAATLNEQLSAPIAADAHQFGHPLYDAT